jgi:DNA-binding transcriptional MocR family regulator
MADFIQRGHYHAHLKKVRLHLQQQSLQYIAYLQAHLPENSKISQPAGGFVLWIEVPDLNTTQLRACALKKQLDIRIGEDFSTLGRYPHCFRLNIGFDMQTPQVQSQLTLLIKLINANIKDKKC